MLDATSARAAGRPARLPPWTPAARLERPVRGERLLVHTT